MVTVPPEFPTSSVVDGTVANERLAALARSGMHLARLVHDTVQRLGADGGADSTGALLPLTHAFDRLACSVRQAIALQHSLQGRDAGTLLAAHDTEDDTENDFSPEDEQEEFEDLLGDLNECLDDPVLDVARIGRELEALALELKREHGIGGTNADILRLPERPKRAERPERPPGPGATVHTLRRPG